MRDCVALEIHTKIESVYARSRRTVLSMLSKTDATYLDLRERILFGKLKAGSAYSAQDMAGHYGLHINMARRLLVALKVGGYLTRSGTSYVIAEFSQSQVEEWRLSLGAIVEIGALRLTRSGRAALDPLATFIDERIRNVPVKHEDFFLGAMGLAHIVLGGRESALAKFVSQFIPQVFFRLLWMADSYADRTGFLVEASDQFLVAARKSDFAGVRLATRFFFDGIAPSLRTLIENMSEGIYPVNDRHDGFQTIENNIAGYPTYAGSSRTLAPMMEPLLKVGQTTLPLC